MTYIDIVIAIFHKCINTTRCGFVTWYESFNLFILSGTRYYDYSWLEKVNDEYSAFICQKDIIWLCFSKHLVPRRFCNWCQLPSAAAAENKMLLKNLLKSIGLVFIHSHIYSLLHIVAYKKYSASSIICYVAFLNLHHFSTFLNNFHAFYIAKKLRRFCNEIQFKSFPPRWLVHQWWTENTRWPLKSKRHCRASFFFISSVCPWSWRAERVPRK